MKSLIKNTVIIFLLVISLPALGVDESIERVTVVGQRPNFFDSAKEMTGHQSLAADDISVQPENLSRWMDALPGVSFNGQGGLMQTVSVRGFSRWRLQTLLDGIPIYTERRAGGGAEFVTPKLIEQVTIVPGAASTYFGSGAMGGALAFRLKKIDQGGVSASLQSGNGERGLTWNDSFGATQVFLQQREGGNGFAANGAPLFDQYKQSTVFINYQKSLDEPLNRAWFLLSDSNDIGKSSSDYPESRITLYPRNRHMVAKLDFNFQELPAAFYLHQSQWYTYINRIGSRENWIENQSNDMGFYISKPWQAEFWQGHWRIESHTRQNVEAREKEQVQGSDQVLYQTSLQAKQWENTVAFTAKRVYEFADLILGTRLHSLYQANELSNLREWNGSAFVAARRAFWKDTFLRISFSSAYRTPSLTERYYAGSTPRGQVLGNEDLQTETSLAFEIALSHQTEHWHAELVGFEQSIDRYIERVEVLDEVIQYQNLSSGKISGVTYSLTYVSDSLWRLMLSGHLLRGESDGGSPLADINPNEHSISYFWQGAKNRFSFTVIARQHKEDIAEGEQVLERSHAFQARWDLDFTSQVKLSIWGDNMSDKLFLSSADRKAPWVRGRQFGVSIDYQY